MTIPMVVMLVSVFVWFILYCVWRPEYTERTWTMDVCRILFGVSALVVIYGLMNKAAF
jgi:hypothetical protein